MCSAAMAFVGLQAFGGLQQASGSEEEGRAQKRYYEYLAGQNELTAQETLKAADQQTSFIQDEGAMSTKSLRASQRQFEGTQRAALAANGISGSSVSVEDLARDTFKREEMDAEAIRYNADTKAYETQVQARNSAIALRSQAAGYRMAGANAMRAGDINATTSLIGTATSIAKGWADYGQTSKGAAGQTSKGTAVPSYANVSGRQIPVAPPNYYRGR